MVIGGAGAVGGVRKIASVYGRQQYYAERAQKLQTPKTFQIGKNDQVTLSTEAMVRAKSAGFVGPQASHAAVALAPSVKAIAYPDPRKEARAQGVERKSSPVSKTGSAKQLSAPATPVQSGATR